VYRKREHLVLDNRSDRKIPVASHSHRCPVSGVDREALNAIYHHWFDVGDMRYPKRRELLFRQMPHIERDDLLSGSDRNVWLVT